MKEQKQDVPRSGAAAEYKVMSLLSDLKDEQHSLEILEDIATLLEVGRQSLETWRIGGTSWNLGEGG